MACTIHAAAARGVSVPRREARTSHRLRCRASVTKPTRQEDSLPRRALLSAVAGGIGLGLLRQPGASAVECSVWGAVTCFPAPPNGEPRYKTFDGPGYDPAKAAEERFKAKMAAEANKAAPAPAPAGK